MHQPAIQCHPNMNLASLHYSEKQDSSSGRDAPQIMFGGFNLDIGSTPVVVEMTPQTTS